MRLLTLGQSVNPGLMKTELQRHSPKMQSVIMVRLSLPEVYQGLGVLGLPASYHDSLADLSLL